MPSRRPRRFSFLSLFYIVVTLGVLVGTSLWMDHGEPVRAVVNGKHEEMQLSFTPQASWYRWYRLGVAFVTADGISSSATITVPQERFDALRLGDTVSIRYLSWLPLIARTADRSTLSVVREVAIRAISDRFFISLALWLGGGFFALWIASKISTPLVFLVGAGWIAAAFPLIFPAPSDVPLPSTKANARVITIALVDRAPARRSSRYGGRLGIDMRRLNAPYHVVQLRVPVPGSTDSVLAIDAVDTGSVVGLVPNAVLPIRYDVGAPREARLSTASRTFAARNRYHMLIPVVGVGMLGILAAWGARTGHLRRRGRPAATSAA